MAFHGNLDQGMKAGLETVQTPSHPIRRLLGLPALGCQQERWSDVYFETSTGEVGTGADCPSR